MPSHESTGNYRSVCGLDILRSGNRLKVQTHKLTSHGELTRSIYPPSLSSMDGVTLVSLDNKDVC